MRLYKLSEMKCCLKFTQIINRKAGFSSLCQTELWDSREPVVLVHSVSSHPRTLGHHGDAPEAELIEQMACGQSEIKVSSTSSP
jgi:hypothetical protein